MKKRLSIRVIKYVAFGLLLLTPLLISLISSSEVKAATYTVTSTDNAGAGTLRQAILDANANGGADQIDFNIAGAGPHTINVTASLPQITEQVTINGSSQSGTVCNGTSTVPQVRVDLNNTANPMYIHPTSVGTEINGLAIANAGLNGYALFVDGDDTVLRCNYFGSFDGSTVASTQLNSDWLKVDADNVTIGGSNASDFNLFLGNANDAIASSGETNATITIQNNHIGTSLDGSSFVSGTSQNGIKINDVHSSVDILDNVINASNYAINFTVAATTSNSITIEDNHIGTDITGNTAFSSTGNAIVLIGAYTNILVQNNNIATTDSNHPAIIAYNGGAVGVSILDNKINVSEDGTTAFPGAGDGSWPISATHTDNEDWTIDGNHIYSNRDSGHAIVAGSGSSDFTITDNIIGLDGTATSCLANQTGGIVLVSTDDIKIGSTNPADANQICTNGSDNAIEIRTAASEVSILGNAISNGGKVIYYDFALPLTTPIVRDSTENSGDTEIDFEIDVAAGDYRAEFFENSSFTNGNDHPMTETFIGFANVTSAGSGPEDFSETITGDGYENITMTLTAIDASPDGFGITSEVGSQEEEVDIQTTITDGVDYVREDTDDHEITQTITNLGPATITDIDFTLSASDCFTTTSTPTSGTATDTGTYAASAWSGTLESGQNLVITHTGDTTCSGVDTLTFTNVVSSIENNGVPVIDNNSANETETETTTIAARLADLQTVTNDDETEIFDNTSGHEITQTITNLGPDTVTDIDFTLSDSDCINITSTPTSGTATNTGTYAANSWSGTLEENQTLIITHTGDTTCSPPDNIVFNNVIATIEDSGSAVVDTNASNNDFSENTAIIDKVTNFVVTQELDNIDDIAIGETLNYTYTLTNNGPHTADISGLDGSGPNGLASNVFVLVTPFELNFIPDSSTNSDLDCALGPIDTNHAMASPVFNTHPDHDVIYCAYVGASPRNIASTESISTTISYEVDATSDLVFTNNVITGWLADDPDIVTLSDPSAFGGPGNICADPPMDIIDCYVGEEINNVAVSLPVADFTIEKEMVAPFDITPGQTVQYDVTLTNRGPMPVNLNTLTGSVGANFVFADVYPSNDLAYDDDDNADIFCNDLGAPASNFTGPVTADHPDHGMLVCVYIGAGQVMEADDSITIRLDFTVQVGASQSFTNYVSQGYTGFFIDNDSIDLSNEFGSATEDQLDEINNDNFDKITTDDGDKDGISDSIEDNGPNSGDANDDGTADSEQANVASYVSSVTGKRVVLEVASECSVYTSGVNQESANSVTDSGYQYPLGLLAFEINCEDDGFTADITKYYFDETNLDYTLRKFHSNSDSYSTVASYTLGQAEIDSTNVLTVDYQVTDGGTLDTDESVNRIIVDPVGLGVVDESAEDNDGDTTTIPSSITSFLADTGAGAMTAKVAAIALLISGGALVLKRWQKRKNEGK